MKKKLVFTSLISIVAGFALFACNTETTAEDNAREIELKKINIELKSKAFWGIMFINPETQCIYTRGNQDRAFVPIIEQEYVYDINGGKCVGPYQREYNSKK